MKIRSGFVSNSSSSSYVIIGTICNEKELEKIAEFVSTNLGGKAWDKEKKDADEYLWGEDFIARITKSGRNEYWFGVDLGGGDEDNLKPTSLDRLNQTVSVVTNILQGIGLKKEIALYTGVIYD